MDERERQKLIAKLKTSKKSEERDQILWYLAGQDKSTRGKPQRPEPIAAGTPSPSTTQDKMQIRLPAGKLGGIGSITALLFVVYGMAAIIPAVLKILQGEMDGDEIRQLITGGVFVFFGIVIFLKAKRAQRKAAEDA
ncbi:MAG TPA: hypothetical protein VFG28_02875 [Syntrophales bacterium]|nr:hypothetical protein [Syntrophales bacterium]